MGRGTWFHPGFKLPPFLGPSPFTQYPPLFTSALPAPPRIGLKELTPYVFKLRSLPPFLTLEKSSPPPFKKRGGWNHGGMRICVPFSVQGGFDNTFQNVQVICPATCKWMNLERRFGAKKEGGIEIVIVPPAICALYAMITIMKKWTLRMKKVHCSKNASLIASWYNWMCGFILNIH